MRYLKTGSLAAALATLFAISTGAQAVSWAKIDDLPGIIEGASLAFRGDVVDVVHREIPVDGRNFPYTETLFRASECFSGCKSGSIVSVRQMGGEYTSLPNRAVFVAGTPDYVVAGEYFVFADNASSRLFGARFGEYGAFRVGRIDAAGKSLVFDHQGSALGRDANGLVGGNTGLGCGQFDAAGQCTRSTAAQAKASSAIALDAEGFAHYARSIVSTAKHGPAIEAPQQDAAQFELALQAFLSTAHGK